MVFFTAREFVAEGSRVVLGEYGGGFGRDTLPLLQILFRIRTYIVNKVNLHFSGQLVCSFSLLGGVLL